MESLQPNVTGKKVRGDGQAPLPPEIALAYRVNDAVKVSGLSRNSIYKLIAKGELRSVLVAGRRLIPADALRELLVAA
jgi:excisionase family DNA binding protein